MTQSISIHSWSDLRQFGINMLTGEACNLGLRLLCDLNEEGRQLMAEYLGIHSTAFSAGWNSLVDGKPSVGSVMLARESLPQIATFALFRKGALAVVSDPSHTFHGVFDAELLTRYEELANRHQTDPSEQKFSIHRNMRGGTPHVGTRNVHAASGRVV